MNSLEKQLANAEIPSTILLYGEESYLVHEACQKLLKILVPNPQPGINYVKWEGEADTLDTFFEDLKNYPFLTDRKIFHCSSGELFLAKQGSPTMRRKFDKFLEHDFPESNILIITCSTGVDKKLNVLKKLNKRGFQIEFLAFKTYNPGDPNKDEVYPYCHQRVQQYGCELLPDAFFELRKRVPDTLWGIMNEIDKLLAYVGENQAITLKDVKTVTSRNKNEQFFDLTDALSDRKLDEVLRIFNTILSHESNVIMIHQMLVQHVYLLFLARQLIVTYLKGALPRGFSYNTLSQTLLPRWNKQFSEEEKQLWDVLLKRHPYIILKTLQSAEKFNDDDLLHFISDMTDLEKRVKSTVINHHIYLELLLARFCRS